MSPTRNPLVVLLLASLVPGCDAPKAAAAEAARVDAEAAQDARPNIPTPSDGVAAPPAEEPVATKAPAPTAPADAAPSSVTRAVADEEADVAADATTPIAVPHATTPTALVGAKPVSAHGVTVSAHTYVNPPRTGVKKHDYWTQLQVWGEITNETTDVLETASARIFFYDAAGKEIGVDSIGTASQKDAGDFGGGERFYADVGFIAPGASVPFHFMRNLDAIKGEVAAIELRARSAQRASGPVPKAVVVDLDDQVVGDKGLQKRTFKGKIRNDGDGPCRAPDLVLVFRDADGKIASVETLLTGVSSNDKLGRGDAIEFDTRAYVYGDDAWRATAKVESFASCKAIY